MTRPSPSPARLALADLESFAARLLAAKGLRADHAWTVAAALAWADARGVASHGLAFLPIYLRMLDEGTIAREANPRVRIDRPALVVIEADRAPGAVAMRFAVDTALDRAGGSGACTAWVRDTTHTGAVGQYAARAAERGFAAIVLNAGPPLMAVHGARGASATTGPIAMAVPGAADEPIVLDMATSVVAFSRLRAAKAAGEPLPAGWALDAQGKSTTDPAAAAVPLPLGGPKGSGLSLMFELMTSTLLASPILMDHLAPQGTHTHRQNALVAVWDVAALRPLADFRADVGALAATLKHLPRAEGCDEILLPGERGARVRSERARNGVPIAPAIWEELTRTANAIGVPVPTTLGSGAARTGPPSRA